jgi:diguanylate cyclase (GGDEF)-like protein
MFEFLRGRPAAGDRDRSEGKTLLSPVKSLGIRQKILLGVVVTCATIVAFTGAATVAQLESVERSARLEAQHLASSVMYATRTQSQPLQRYIEGMDALYKRDIFVVDAKKQTLADVVPSEIGEVYADDPHDEVGQTLRDAEVRTFVETSAQHPASAKMIVVPIHGGGREADPVVGAIVLEYSNIYDELMRIAVGRIAAMAALGLLAALVVGVAGARFATSIARRLRRLQGGFERVAGGAYGERLVSDSSDEIGALQAAFNRMAADLDQSHVKLIADMDRHKDAARQIERLAYFDTLTGLSNRTMFSRLLERVLADARAKGSAGAGFGVMFLDLDRFKVINDTLGHQAGDALLAEVAARLKSAVRDADTVSRLGGDEFVVLMPQAQDAATLARIAHRVLGAVSMPFRFGGHELRVTASVGISAWPADGDDEAALMKHADIAMYKAKEDGGNTAAFYTERMNTNSVERLAFESSLRRALERGEFELYYQPKIETATRRMKGVEALVRWNHPDLGLVSPAKFIPLAESTGLIVPIGRWVLETACRQQAAWARAGLPSLHMAVNLSARQFDDEGLLGDIDAALHDSGMDPAMLEVEITESVLMHDATHGTELLRELKRRGLRVSIDDFGTGYSSLSTLKRFPVDTLKIDRSFVRDLPANEEDRAIADAIVAMGRTLGLTLVAEGVETKAQVDYLHARGCDELQGFYFSRPVPACQLEALLVAGTIPPAAGETARGDAADRAEVAAVVDS